MWIINTIINNSINMNNIGLINANDVNHLPTWETSTCQTHQLWT